MAKTNDHRLRPSEYAEKTIITSILNNTYPPNTHLPPERDLAQIIGVTRPTLRENLHRLAGEGWISIQHGKSTQVNNYWEKGGLSLLGTLARYLDFLPLDFITQLLEFRVIVIPECARLCGERAPEVLVEQLKGMNTLPDEAKAFTEFDWKLQETMAKNCGNRIYPLILNDFTPVFNDLAIGYYSLENGRSASRRYYRNLSQVADKGGEAVFKAAKDAMLESLHVWNQLQSGDVA